MKKQDIKLWTWWTHKKYGITMELTMVNVRRDLVNLWDKPMRFRWTGSYQRFRREFGPRS